MLSVNNMLNNHQHQQMNYKRSAVLNISNLLNVSSEPQQKSPSLSPSLTSSPASVTSSYSGYPFPQINNDHIWEDIKQQKQQPYKQQPATTASLLINHHSDLTVEEEVDDDSMDGEDSSVKAKRKRANTKQLEVLNRVFDRTFFPSTQMRAELGRQLGMSPRTVQIWFQNRRQAMRTRERQRLIKLRNDVKSSTSIKAD